MGGAPGIGGALGQGTQVWEWHSRWFWPGGDLSTASVFCSEGRPAPWVTGCLRGTVSGWHPDRGDLTNSWS